MGLLGVSGSLRTGSYNTALLEAAAAHLPMEVELVVWRGLADIPPFDEELDPVPRAVTGLREEIARADAVLISTPEYNASVPGTLKNALDWVSRPLATNPLRDKPVAVVGASTGLFGAVWAQADLRRILRTIGARVDDRDLPVSRAHEAFTVESRLRDPRLALRLKAIVDDLIDETARRVA